MSQGIKRLINSAHGQYVPQAFIEAYAAESWGITPEDAAILAAGPDHDLYWETWDDVLGYATHTPGTGHVWRLNQDGDLFCYCQDLMTILEQDEFGFDVDMEEFIESRGFILELQQSKGKYYYWVNSRNGDRATWAYPYSNALRDCIEQNHIDAIPAKE